MMGQLIVSPDESRGYYGFTFVTPPPPAAVEISCPETAVHNFAQILFIFGGYVDIMKNWSPIDFEPDRIISLDVRPLEMNHLFGTENH